jgi:hypothetical protein
MRYAIINTYALPPDIDGLYRQKSMSEPRSDRAKSSFGAVATQAGLGAWGCCGGASDTAAVARTSRTRAGG